MNRREMIAAAAALPAAAQAVFPQKNVAGLDNSVDSLLKRQILDKTHRYYGSYQNAADGLY
jgi:hypothetical protein